MHVTLSDIPMGLRDVSNDTHMMLPHLFPEGLRVNPTAHIDIFINRLSNESIFYTARNLMTFNNIQQNHTRLQLWQTIIIIKGPQNLINPFHYYLWSIVNKELNNDT